MQSTLIQVIQLVFYLWQLMLLARILLSWVQVDPYNPIVQFLFSVTEPILRPLRELLPQTGMFDFSPLVAIILAQVVQIVLVQVIRSLF
ncbi:MAG: YggT family protein [Anaerolineae bacterium]|nr:YggT family protein [Anaerolineae bacterium]